MQIVHRAAFTLWGTLRQIGAQLIIGVPTSLCVAFVTQSLVPEKTPKIDPPRQEVSTKVTASYGLPEVRLATGDAAPGPCVTCATPTPTAVEPSAAAEEIVLARPAMEPDFDPALPVQPPKKNLFSKVFETVTHLR